MRALVIAIGMFWLCLCGNTNATTIVPIGFNHPTYDFGIIPIGESREAIFVADTSPYPYIVTNEDWKFWAGLGFDATSSFQSWEMYMFIGTIFFDEVQITNLGNTCQLGVQLALQCWLVEVTTLPTTPAFANLPAFDTSLAFLHREYICGASGCGIIGGNEEGGILFSTAVFTPGTFTAVPLPATLSLLGTGLSGLGAIGWVRRRKQATASA